MRARAFSPARWELDKVLWQNAQWAVTTYGIENVAGPYHYHIHKGNLHEGHWVAHMSEKNWVDAALFAEAFAQAQKLHKVSP